MWWAKTSKRPSKAWLRWTEGTRLPSAGKVERRIPSVCTTSGLLLLKTKTASSWPGSDRTSWVLITSWGGRTGVACAKVKIGKNYNIMKRRIIKFGARLIISLVGTGFSSSYVFRSHIRSITQWCDDWRIHQNFTSNCHTHAGALFKLSDVWTIAFLIYSCSRYWLAFLSRSHPVFSSLHPHRPLQTMDAICKLAQSELLI